MSQPTAPSELSGFAVIDVETTGSSPHDDRVIEVAVIRTDATGNITSEYASLVNPQRDPGPTHVHGISPADLSEAPRFAEVLGDVFAALQGSVLVAHGASYVLAFLQAEIARAEFTLPEAPAICTHELANRMLRGAPHGLSERAAAIGHVLAHPNHARHDARAVAALLQHFGRLQASAGAQPFQRELDKARGVRWPRVPRTGRALTRRASVAQRAAEDAYLARLVDRLPPSASPAPPEVRAYLRQLDEILEDRRVTAQEAEALYELAKRLGAGGEDLTRAHRSYLTGLVRAALLDGVVTAVEGADLARVTQLLGLTEADLQAAFADAADAAAPPPMPGEDRPLRQGMSIAFTGATRVPRDELERRARAAGLEVHRDVTSKLDVLVVDDPYRQSDKFAKARSLGLRILAEAVYLALVARVAKPASTGSHAPLIPQSFAELSGRRVFVAGAASPREESVAARAVAAGATLADRLTPFVDVAFLETEARDAALVAEARALGVAVVALSVADAWSPRPGAQMAATPQNADLAHAPTLSASVDAFRPPSAEQRSWGAPAATVAPPQGWYPDPCGQAMLRYWDGARWTDHVHCPRR